VPSTTRRGLAETHSQRTVAFHDPSSRPDNPGWPLRNILYYLSHRHALTSLNVVCLRSGAASRSGRLSLPSQLESVGDRPQAVGWERNKAGKLASRVADLGPMMDPTK
jgi:ubiquitin-like modifier-activating enzyme ATG7